MPKLLRMMKQLGQPRKATDGAAPNRFGFAATYFEQHAQNKEAKSQEKQTQEQTEKQKPGSGKEQAEQK
ncbi:MAG: hypothetical protein NT013_15745 [Planctomycetia bacterium]|nr:hypothetical protein [Planctomycetia bacterium]